MVFTESIRTRIMSAEYDIGQEALIMHRTFEQTKNNHNLQLKYRLKIAGVRLDIAENFNYKEPWHLGEEKL